MTTKAINMTKKLELDVLYNRRFGHTFSNDKEIMSELIDCGTLVIYHRAQDEYILSRGCFPLPVASGVQKD